MIYRVPGISRLFSTGILLHTFDNSTDLPSGTRAVTSNWLGRVSSDQSSTAPPWIWLCSLSLTRQWSFKAGLQTQYISNVLRAVEHCERNRISARPPVFIRNIRVFDIQHTRAMRLLWASTKFFVLSYSNMVLYRFSSNSGSLHLKEIQKNCSGECQFPPFCPASDLTSIDSTVMAWEVADSISDCDERLHSMLLLGVVQGVKRQD